MLANCTAVPAHASAYSNGQAAVCKFPIGFRYFFLSSVDVSPVYLDQVSFGADDDLYDKVLFTDFISFRKSAYTSSPIFLASKGGTALPT